MVRVASLSPCVSESVITNLGGKILVLGHRVSSPSWLVTSRSQYLMIEVVMGGTVMKVVMVIVSKSEVVYSTPSSENTVSFILPRSIEVAKGFGVMVVR